MAPKRYNTEGEKKCTGPLHREGVYLPLDKFSIKADGKPISQCRRCRAAYMGRNPDNVFVDIEIARPIFERLAFFAGGRMAASALLGLPRGFFSTLKRSKNVRGERVRAAQKILDDNPTMYDMTREDWWVDAGSPAEIPRFGWEALGKDF